MLTVKTFVPLCVSELATVVAVNVREFTVAEAMSRVIVTAGEARLVFPITTSSVAPGTCCFPYAPFAVAPALATRVS